MAAVITICVHTHDHCTMAGLYSVYQINVQSKSIRLV